MVLHMLSGRIAACPGRILELDDDLSTQLILLKPLQDMVLEAGLLLHLHFSSHFAGDDTWEPHLRNLSLPVSSLSQGCMGFMCRAKPAVRCSRVMQVVSLRWPRAHYSGLRSDLVSILAACSWPAEQLTAVHNLEMPSNETEMAFFPEQVPQPASGALLHARAPCTLDGAAFVAGCAARCAEGSIRSVALCRSAQVASQWSPRCRAAARMWTSHGPHCWGLATPWVRRRACTTSPASRGSPCTGACMLHSRPIPLPPPQFLGSHMCLPPDCMVKRAECPWDAPRVTQLPPGITHLHLTHCHVGGAELPGGCRLRSLQLHSCFSGHAGSTHQASRAPMIDLLEWLEAAQDAGKRAGGTEACIGAFMHDWIGSPHSGLTV